MLQCGVHKCGYSSNINLLFIYYLQNNFKLRTYTLANMMPNLVLDEYMHDTSKYFQQFN